tara:strand:- start:703 stop:1215 length:513 start_codon:yes stop_codon:yes gene_type:complete
MKSFQQHIIEFDNPQIYCDMDGVVADFVKFTSNYLGTKFKDELWQDLPVDLFLQLPKMPDADVLWGYIKQFQPFMLTAVPRESRGPIAKRAWKDKTRWMMKNFKLPSSRMKIVLRKNKKNFAMDGRDKRPNILIDDHIGNIKEWESAGGIGILHTDAASTINDLKKIGFP